MGRSERVGLASLLYSRCGSGQGRTVDPCRRRRSGRSGRDDDRRILFLETPELKLSSARLSASPTPFQALAGLAGWLAGGRTLEVGTAGPGGTRMRADPCPAQLPAQPPARPGGNGPLGPVDVHPADIPRLPVPTHPGWGGWKFVGRRDEQMPRWSGSPHMPTASCLALAFLPPRVTTVQVRHARRPAGIPVSLPAFLPDC